MRIAGVKDNKCLLKGVQGVCKQIESTAAEGASYYYSTDSAENNCRFVLKNYQSVLVGSLPTQPEPDFNFDITIQNSNGFYGTLDAVFTFLDYPTTGTGTHLKIYWNNPDFDLTADYTVIHVHVWHDGINWCANIDGYVETTT